MLTNATGGQVVTVLIVGIIGAMVAAFLASVFSMGRSNTGLARSIMDVFKALMLLALIGTVGWVIGMLYFGMPGPQ